MSEERTTVVVTLSDSAVDTDMARVKSDLEDAGLEVGQVLEFIGQIVGTTSSDDLAPLRAVEGVDAVEVSQTVQLPPPDSAVQ